MTHLQKSSWQKFIAHKNFQLLGSSPADMTERDYLIGRLDILKKAIEEEPIILNRFYTSGKTSIRFKTDKNTYSWLDKGGKVHQFDDIFVIQKSYKDEYTHKVYHTNLFYRFEK